MSLLYCSINGDCMYVVLYGKFLLLVSKNTVLTAGTRTILTGNTCRTTSVLMHTWYVTMVTGVLFGGKIAMPFQPLAKTLHQPRSAQKWLTTDMMMHLGMDESSIIHQRKEILGLSALQSCCSVPIRDLSSLFVHDLLCCHCLSADSIVPASPAEGIGHTPVCLPRFLKVCSLCVYLDS